MVLGRFVDRHLVDQRFVDRHLVDQRFVDRTFGLQTLGQKDFWSKRLLVERTFCRQPFGGWTFSEAEAKKNQTQHN